MKISSINSHRSAAGSVRTVVIIVVVLAILVLGLIGMVVLQKTGPTADKSSPPRAIPTVKIIVAEKGDHQLYVRTQGEVKASMSTQLSSQVMGRATMVSPKLKAGGSFAKNEVMIEIERADYVSALARAESALADAQLALQQEQARAEQSLRDWAKLGKGAAPDLVARKPQIVSAKARVTAAEADVVRATRDLERTTIRAPYRCRVDQAYVDFGATIAAGMRVADVYSTDVRELRVPVPLDELGYLNEGGLVGSPVDIEAEFAGETRTWSGEIIRSEGQVDRTAMMMYQVVEIAASDEQPLSDLPPPGLFVRASIKGREMKQIVEIPRTALNADHSVLLVDDQDQLQVVDVKVARTMQDTVLISSGISAGDRVIVSAIETPVTGMKLEIETVVNEEK
ncbi:efflux RND transporter periplasmic adaptor subunit [Verrucomicrobiaceae bacterium 5K15]|uniref:Efflux RND transporter periplasmic adaptor subunit n=1 Tax=Oceaniferula flava TaxID=2800421 RepID=A0AAE2SCQ2_9BACT|nr:efflux RND transporter periplasmic adaptor subunit [Oceaniferula flavus]MBK1853866.1 efflux RND transporter periplasmic adaptor subunit [Oceaniferula flavus]MBM1135172.1 efflux RND transporter periplasmic adaptor subunit [Oceaniferula flavus]